jgi:hypothetical protein
MTDPSSFVKPSHMLDVRDIPQHLVRAFPKNTGVDILKVRIMRGLCTPYIIEPLFTAGGGKGSGSRPRSTVSGFMKVITV